MKISHETKEFFKSILKEKINTFFILNDVLSTEDCKIVEPELNELIKFFERTGRPFIKKTSDFKKGFLSYGPEYKLVYGSKKVIKEILRYF